MKKEYLIYGVIALLLTSCFSSKQAQPIFPENRSGSTVYYSEYKQTLSPFPYADTLVSILKEAKCIKRKSYIFKNIPLSIYIRLGESQDSVIYRLYVSSTEPDCDLQDVYNNLGYIVTNPEHIQWLRNYQDEVNLQLRKLLGW